MRLEQGVKRAFCALAGAMVMPEYLFADDDSLSFEMSYIAEVWALASGGNDKGTEYLDKLSVGVAKNWEQSGISLYVSGFYNNGNGVSANHVGDVQAISNIEASVRAARANEVWLEQKFGEAVSVKVGLLDTNAEFDVLDASGMFLGGPHGIGSDIGQTGDNGPSIFPVTAFGGRFQADISDSITIRTALIDAVPGDPDHPKRTTIKLGNGEGAFSINELEYRVGRSKVLAGYWRYTADFDTHAGARRGGNDGFYLRGEGQLTGADGENGLYAFGRAGVADGGINTFSTFFSAGLRQQGVFSPERQDALGFAVLWAETSSEFRQYNPGTKKREIALELTYDIAVTEWLSIQPDIQYIVDPLEGQNNALAFGLRTTFTLP